MIYIQDNSSSIFSKPYRISTGNVSLYTRTSHVGIYLPSPPSDVVLIGRESDDKSHYSIVLENGKYLLWGFTSSPKYMTSSGKELFINIADHLATGTEITVSSGIRVIIPPKTLILDPKRITPSIA